jgi:hypothetical protein
MWVQHPDQSVPPPTIPLLRAPMGTPLTVALRGEPRRLFLHFAAGRTWPCTQHRCPICKRQIGHRLYAFYPCYTLQMKPAVLELTAQAEGSLLGQMSPHTDEPRGVVQVVRPPGRRNSPVQVRWQPERAEHARLPDALNVEQLENALLRVWGLPPRNGEASHEEWLERVAAVIASRLPTREGRS